MRLLPFGTNLAHERVIATIRKRGNRYHVQVRRAGRSRLRATYGDIFYEERSNEKETDG